MAKQDKFLLKDKQEEHQLSNNFQVTYHFNNTVFLSKII